MFRVKILWSHPIWTTGLSQKIYIGKALECLNMSKAKSINIHVAKNYGLNYKDCPKTPADKMRIVIVLYASATKSLMYAVMCI